MQALNIVAPDEIDESDETDDNAIDEDDDGAPIPNTYGTGVGPYVDSDTSSVFYEEPNVSAIGKYDVDLFQVNGVMTRE